MRTFLLSLALLATPVAAQAEFSPVTERAQFVSLIENRDLTRFGISLQVTTDGDIKGRAFGRDVRGAWKWSGDYFCRNLYWGSMELGSNCQAVRRNGGTLRFISDQGAGRQADLYLE